MFISPWGFHRVIYKHLCTFVNIINNNHLNSIFSIWYQSLSFQRDLNISFFLLKSFFSHHDHDMSLTDTTDVFDSGTLSNPIVSVNMINVTKLCSTNYITWSAQVKSFFRGYDLLKYIDPTTILPLMTISDSGSDVSNPEYLTWKRQDSLLDSSLMGSIKTAHQPLIATATTALEALNILASTYAKPTRGHIKQLQNQLRQSVKGNKIC